MAIVLSRRGGGDGGTSTSVVSSTVTDLSSAQILALFTTPVEVVPAPGAGRFLIAVCVLAQLKFATTAYVAPGVLLLVHDNDTVYDHAVWSNTFLTNTESFTMAGDLSFAGEPVANTNGQALKVWADVGNPTLGDGTLRIVTYYSVMTLA